VRELADLKVERCQRDRARQSSVMGIALCQQRGKREIQGDEKRCPAAATRQPERHRWFFDDTAGDHGCGKVDH